MPLLDHLGELRRRVTIVVVSLLLCAIVMYAATPTIIDILFDPVRAVLPPDADLTIVTLLGGFTIRFKVAFFSAFIVCTPLLLWEFLGFFLPALKPSEKRWVVPTVAAMVALFFFGMIFCYIVIQRAAFGWMIDQTEGFANVLVNAEDYLNIEMLLEVGFGIAFELPLVIFYLSILHVVPYSSFRKNWRYVYVGLLLLSGVVTPDASPVTMLLMFAALVSLYEVALAVARAVISARDGKEALKWTRQQYEERDLS